MGREGSLWAERERKGEGERGKEGGRGREWKRSEGDEEGEDTGALGGNLCLAFEGWVSYNHSFVTSQKG